MAKARATFNGYRGPAGGWGSARSVGNILRKEGVAGSAGLALTRQNKVDGYQCVSCAWVKPAAPLPLEVCENGVKATAWELTAHRCEPAFFKEHTVSDLLAFDDHALEAVGRLTHPLRYDAASDRYLPVSWGQAIAEIGRELRAIRDRRRAIFYSSGRCSNEASYLYGLFARAYGNNNLPDSSNMCHETTSVALPESIGVPVGTTALADFAHADCILFFGQNTGSNSPRMLHALQAASRRGVPIVVFNPLKERGLERFVNPQSPVEMLTGEETRIASQYHQVRAGGDLAALTGLCKAVVDLDKRARAQGMAPVLDMGFVGAHTHGFEALIAWLERQEWSEIEAGSGLTRAALEGAARVYASARATIGVYGMGLTQHQAGVITVQMLVNLLLLRGNIGREGAGICPVRGHSNVQGQRTVGITEKPELVPMDRLRTQYGFEPPTEKGFTTVEACEAVLDGDVDAFVMLGGNFVRAVPDTSRIEPAWRRMRLTVNIATKLNRSHLMPGKVAYLLPVLGRLETDVQATGPQELSIEDSTGHIHASRAVKHPASPHLLSEVRLVCELARATLEPNPRLAWEAWSQDYRLIRAAIARTYPETFHDYEERMHRPGGFQRPLPARERVWKTKTGKANFIRPEVSIVNPNVPGHDDALRLITLRSNDQFNTTVYGYSDRFRGIEGTRQIVLMNAADMARLGFKERQTVGLRTLADDGVERRLEGLTVVPYDIPKGCLGAYYPEANVLLPLSHYAAGSKTPAAKSIPVSMHASSGPAQPRRLSGS